jgi:hypothetical protein
VQQVDSIFQRLRKLSPVLTSGGKGVHVSARKGTRCSHTHEGSAQLMIEDAHQVLAYMNAIASGDLDTVVKD